jgi:hypothetical protein
MATVLFTLLGAVLGAALGIVLPVSFSMYTAWLADFEPGAGAPTAFALMLPFTVLAGLILGASAGLRRATKGTWTSTNSSGMRTGFWNQLCQPSPLEKNLVQELANAPGLGDKQDRSLHKRNLLRAAYQQYQGFAWSLGTKFQLIAICVLMPFLIPFALVGAILYAAKRMHLRKRIEYAEEAWRAPI